MHSIPHQLILRPRDVCVLLGIARSTLYLKIAEGDFPKPIQLSKNPSKNCAVGWKRVTIDQWLEECAKAESVEL